MFSPHNFLKHVKKCMLSSITVKCVFLSSVATAQVFQPNAPDLKVCSDAGFLPFEMKDSAGHWQGFDVDMMKSFAESLHKKLEMVQISFDGIIPALLSGKCDLIAAGMTVTPEREKVVAFSDTTFVNALSIGIKNAEKNQGKYKTLADLDKDGLKIAVKTGYTSDIHLTKTLKHAQVLRFDQDTDLYLAVLQGRATALVSDSTYVSIIAKEKPNTLIILPTDIFTQKFSVAARKQDSALINTFNKWLVTWKKSAEFKNSYAKYFK